MPKLPPFSLITTKLVREEPPAYLTEPGQLDGWLPHPARKPLLSPEDSARFFRLALPDDGREHFWVVGLSVRHYPLLATEVSVGCLTSSLVHPRELMKPLILGSCAAFIIAHNHPSGDPEPSAEDISLTRRLQSAGTLLGVDLLDHIVIGSGSDRYVSMKQRGVL